MIDRRKLLTIGALGAAGTALTACSSPETGGQSIGKPAVHRKKRRLTMVTTWPKGLPGLGEAAERVAKLIEVYTEGSITVRVRAAGELVPAFECFDAVPKDQCTAKSKDQN